MTDWMGWRFAFPPRVPGSVVMSNRRKSGKWRLGRQSLVFSADPQRRDYPSRFTRTTQTDQSGYYSLEGLVPGKYLVCALVDHQSGNEWDPDFLRSLEKDSKRIDLSPGRTVQESLVTLSAAN